MEEFVCAILESHLPPEMYAQVITKIDLALYEPVFIHNSINTETNYEYHEFVGDAILNAAVVEYITKKYKGLRIPKAVKILARLKILLISKTFLSRLASKHGFSPYIKTVYLNPNILEDVFEAFIGCTFQQVGYSVCSALIASFLDRETIPNSYETLFDARTRIKELLDINPDLGSLEFSTRVCSDPTGKTSAVGTYCSCTLVSKGPNPAADSRRVVAEDWACNKTDAIQKASEKGILVLKAMGYERLASSDLLELIKHLE